MVFAVMNEINKVRASSSVRIGEVIIKGVCGLAADIVATSEPM